MALLNATDVQSEDDLSSSGIRRLEPAIYHVAVNHAEEKGSKVKGTPGIEVEFQALAEGLAGYKKIFEHRGDKNVLVGLEGGALTKEQTGSTIPMFATLLGKDDSATEACQKNCTRLALCCGVIHPGQEIEPDWSEAVGREIFIEVKAATFIDKKGEKRTGSEVEFLGYWTLGNTAMARVPRDADSPGMRALAKAGGGKPAAAAKSQSTAPAGKGDGAGNGAKAAAQPATVAGTRGKWDNI